MAWAVLALILLHSLLEYPLWYGPFQLAFGLSLWLLWRAPDSPTGVAVGPLLSGRVPVLAVSSASFLIAVVAYAAWDYQRVSQIYLVPGMRWEAYQDNTLEKIQNSWLFQDQVCFAELTTTDLTPDNALHINQLAQFPPCFSSNWTPVMTMPRSTALHMS